VAGGVPVGEIARYQASPRSARHLAWNADGTQVLFAAEGEGIRGLVVDTGQLVSVTDGRNDSSPASNPTARTGGIAYLDGGDLRILGDQGSKRYGAGLGWKVTAFAWSPDGGSIVYAATGLFGNRLGIYDVASGEARQLDWDRGSEILHLVWPAQSDDFLIGASVKVSGRTLGVIMAGSPTKSPSDLVMIPGSIDAIAASPDGRTVYFLSDKTIRAFSRETGAQTTVADRAGDTLAVSPDGKWLLTNPAGIAAVPASGGRLKQIVSASGVQEISWSARGQIAALVSFGGQMDLWTFRVDDFILN
jgi:WD40 repeat protein